jgi:galactose mutarotase-like enzyme
MQLAYSHQSIEFSPLGGQIISWKSNKNGSPQSILYTGSSPRRSGIPILYPFADPLENDVLLKTNTHLPQHGFARSVKWELNKLDQHLMMADYIHNPKSEWFERYPFEHDVCVLYTLHDTSNSMSHTCALSISMIVHNSGDKEMPIAPGYHPYWPVEHTQKHLIRINGQTPPLDFDHPTDSGIFMKNGDTTLIDMPWGEIKQTTGYRFKHVVVWSQTPEQPDSDFVCIEPFTRKTNGINTNPIVIQPGEKWKSKVRWDVTFHQ